jgi:hypothetical protein
VFDREKRRKKKKKIVHIIVIEVRREPDILRGLARLLLLVELVELVVRGVGLCYS